MPKKKKLRVVQPAQSSEKSAGEEFREAVLDMYNLEDFELVQLDQAVQLLDRAEQAKAVIESQGLIVTDKYGRSKEHPAVGIERQSRTAFLRAVKALNLDIEPPLGRLGAPGKHNRR